MITSRNLSGEKKTSPSTINSSLSSKAGAKTSISLLESFTAQILYYPKANEITHELVQTFYDKPLKKFQGF